MTIIQSDGKAFVILPRWAYVLGLVWALGAGFGLGWLS